jgi:Ca-activated chloride channel family protein
MKTLLSILAIMLFSSLAPAPQVRITGVVTDSNGTPLSGVTVMIKGTAAAITGSGVTSGTNVTTGPAVTTGPDGFYSITAGADAKIIVFTYPGMKRVEEKIAGRTVINIVMIGLPLILNDLVVVEVREEAPAISHDRSKESRAAGAAQASASRSHYHYVAPVVAENTESYSPVAENGYKDPGKAPYSTFSIDVDNASYSNVRRFINLGQQVPEDAVRIEEMVNYFKYDYPQADGQHPFSVYTETGICPWNKSHYLLHIGLRAKEIDKGELPPSNLVFLLDVSGSMDQPNKLPLLKSAFGLLVNELRAQDRVAIVVYAGAAGVVLESTPGNRKEIIMQALDNLQAGGSTAGRQGIMLAYKIAEKNFMREGNNRIILATDGDFNVGVSDNTSMERLVEEKRGLGVYMTVLGFGMGNIKDDKMEIIADKGNGNYAYIDNIQEARRVLVQEFGGTLFTIAKDVKFQVEFNPAYVKSYRLVGYENRLLNDEDFNDDTKDAGEMGAGHTVTALYEIVPAGSDENLPLVDPLRYQQEHRGFGALLPRGDTPGNSPHNTLINSPRDTPRDSPRELCNIKLRYKLPDGLTSKMFEKPVGTLVKQVSETTDRFRFSAAVASFGMILRNSPYKGNASVSDVVSLASGARGTDPDGYRAEFVRLAGSINDRQFPQLR